jgi:hypothetical protein
MSLSWNDICLTRLVIDRIILLMDKTGFESIIILLKKHEKHPGSSEDIKLGRST